MKADLAIPYIEDSLPVLHARNSYSLILQDIYKAIRPVYFKTNLTDEFAIPYWTIGGTLTVFECNGKFYAVTAKHTVSGAAEFTDFEDLVVTTRHPTAVPAGQPVRLFECEEVGFSKLISKKNGKVDEDDLDLVIVQLSHEDQVDKYLLQNHTICGSIKGDQLRVVGYSKSRLQLPCTPDEKFSITPITFGFYFDPSPGTDTTFMRGSVEYSYPVFEQFKNDFTGLSGAPVFNETRGGLCGMLISAGVSSDCKRANFHFIGAEYIVQLTSLVGPGNNGTIKVDIHDFSSIS